MRGNHYFLFLYLTLLSLYVTVCALADGDWGDWGDWDGGPLGNPDWWEGGPGGVWPPHGKVPSWMWFFGQGKAGLDGRDGRVGDMGDKGDCGDPGEKGEKGNKGSTGPKGVTGDKGQPVSPPPAQTRRASAVRASVRTYESRSGYSE